MRIPKVRKGNYSHGVSVGVSSTNNCNFISHFIINQIYCNPAIFEPALHTSVEQEQVPTVIASKKRIVVDLDTRIKLTEYFFSRKGRVSPKEVSQQFSIGFENARKLLRKLHKGQSITEKPIKKKHSSKLLPEHEAIIQQLVSENPKISNQTIANILSSLTINPICVSRSTIRRHRLEIMQKTSEPYSDEFAEGLPFDSSTLDNDYLLCKTTYHENGSFDTLSEFSGLSQLSMPFDPFLFNSEPDDLMLYNIL